MAREGENFSKSPRPKPGPSRAGGGRGDSACPICGNEMGWHFRRWAKRRAENGIDEDVAFALIAQNYESGFKCIYCGVAMDFHAPPPGWRWASIEHKTSRWAGGDNHWQNLGVCCHRCNCVKATLDADDFRAFLNIIGKNDAALLERLMSVWFEAALARAIKRDRVGREDATPD